MNKFEREFLEKSKEYEQMFGGCFPTAISGGDLQEMVKEINRCLETERPYEYEKGLIY